MRAQMRRVNTMINLTLRGKRWRFRRGFAWEGAMAGWDFGLKVRLP
jgi:hypothetical protein